MSRLPQLETDDDNSTDEETPRITEVEVPEMENNDNNDDPNDQEAPRIMEAGVPEMENNDDQEATIITLRDEPEMRSDQGVPIIRDAEVPDMPIDDPFYREVLNAYRVEIPAWRRKLLRSILTEQILGHQLKHELGIQLRNPTFQTSERQNDDDDDDNKVANQDQEVPNIMIEVPERNFNDPDHAEVAGDVDVPATSEVAGNDADPAVTEASEVTDGVPAEVQRDTNTAEVSQ